jgi:hypothetical protein
VGALIRELAISGHRKTDGTVNASGKVRCLLPATQTEAPVFSNAACTATHTQPIPLSAGGKATIYTKVPLDLEFQDSSGATLESFSYGNVERAESVMLENLGYSGTLASGSQGAGGKTFLDLVLSNLFGSLGGLDGQFLLTASATARALKERLGEQFVSVKDFNAEGDGIAVDTSPVQAAINYCASIGGGVVYFPPGTYLMDAALTNVTDAVSFLGAGPAASIIRGTNASAGLLSITGADSFFIKDLAFRHATTSTGAALTLSGCVSVSLQGIVVYEHRTGISVVGANPRSISLSGSSYVEGLITDAASVCINYNPASGGGDFLIANSELNGQDLGTCVSFAGASSRCYITGCTIAATAGVGVAFAAALTGTKFRIIGNDLSATTKFSFGAAAEPAGFYQYGNGADGTSVTVATTSAVTPNRVLGDEIRYNATGSGITVTVNAPTPTPARRGVRLTIHFFNNNAGVTTWTLNAIFHVNAAISTTTLESTAVTFAWDNDGSVWREISRAVTT